MTCDAVIDSFADASCCIVEVVNGGCGLDTDVLRLTWSTLHTPSLLRATIFSAVSFDLTLYFLPSTSLNSHLNAALRLSLSKNAYMFQYSSGLKSRISRSRSTIILSATDCTRPAD